MTVSALVAQYGYAFVFAGALTEGESVLLAAGFAAHRGMLELDRVIAVAFVAGTLGDQFYFYLGRRHGQRLLARWPALQARAQRVRPLLERHPNAAIFSLRLATNSARCCSGCCRACTRSRRPCWSAC